MGNPRLESQSTWEEDSSYLVTNPELKPPGLSQQLLITNGRGALKPNAPQSPPGSLLKPKGLSLNLELLIQGLKNLHCCMGDDSEGVEELAFCRHENQSLNLGGYDIPALRKQRWGIL